MSAGDREWRSDGGWGEARAARAVAAESSDEICLVDPDGVITYVNAAWIRFCRDNGGELARCAIGASYAAACEAAQGDPGADAVAMALRAALRGDLDAPLRVAIPCHSPSERRWFDVLVSSRLDADGTCLGATVVLSASSRPAALSRHPAQPRLPPPRAAPGGQGWGGGVEGGGVDGEDEAVDEPTRPEIIALAATLADLALADLSLADVVLAQFVRLLEETKHLLVVLPPSPAPATAARAGHPAVGPTPWRGCPVCGGDRVFTRAGWAYDRSLRIDPVARARCRSCGWEGCGPADRSPGR